MTQKPKNAANAGSSRDEPRFKHLWMTQTGKTDPDTGKPREYWTKIGVAYENRDGSYSLYLKAFPVDGRVVMQEPWPRESRRPERPPTLPGEREVAA